jgi:hypothetical protein
MKNATITNTNIFAGTSSFITTRAALERLGWDFEDMGIEYPYDHIRIEECEYTGRLKWSPCDQYGDNSLAASHDTGDDAKTIQDLADLAASGELQPL